MIKDNESNQAEEFSQCLDSLNDNSHPAAEDEQIKELIDVAALVKQSYRQEELPRVLIDEIVDNLATEFQEKTRKRRNQCLYSGLVGTAAAVIIAAFMQFLLPHPADYHIAQQIDDGMDKQKITAADDQPSHPMIADSTNTMIPQQAQPPNNTKVSAAVPLEEESAASVSKVLKKIINAAESPEIDQHKQVAVLQEETPKDMPMGNSVSMAKTSISSLQKEKDIEGRKMARMMVMPNKTTQSITVDRTNGDIKQVYNLGNQDEIVITQGLSDESRVKGKESSAQNNVQAFSESRAAQPLTKKAQDSMNSLTVKVDQYNITIEGKKTSEELQKIAESLIEKEIEQ